MPKSRTRRKKRPRPRVEAPSASSAAARVGLPTISFPADVLGLARPAHTDIRIDVLLATADDLVHRLPIRLLRRIMAGSRVELWGQDLSGTFEVHLTSSADGQWQMRSQVVDEGLNGREMLASLTTIEAFRRATRAGLTLAGAMPGEWSPIDPVAVPPLPDGLLDVVAAHAELEERLGVSVPTPISYSAAEIRDTLQTTALLRGETVSQTWSEVRWPMPAVEASDLVDGVYADDAFAMVEVEDDWQWQLGAAHVPIGRVSVQYLSTRIKEIEVAGSPARGDAVVVLAPGEEDRVLFRLADTDPGDLDVPPQSWFWTSSWQEREAEVDAHLAEGEVTVHEDAEALFEHLDASAPSVEV